MKVSLLALLRRKPAFWVALAGVLLAGTALALAGAYTVWKEQRDEVAAAFLEEAQSRYAVVARETEAQMDLLAAAQALYAASHKVEREEFQAFAGMVLRQAPVMRALEWIPRVPAAEREACEQGARREGLRDFQITERDPQAKLVRAGVRQEYFPVLFVEPYKGNEAALGFDLASDPVRRDALELALQTGKLQATARVKLVQEPAHEWGCLVFAPVCRRHEAGGLPASTAGDCLGFVSGVIRMKDMFGAALARLKLVGIDLEILDQSAPIGEQLVYSHPSRLHSNGGGGNPLAQPTAKPPTLEFTRELPFAGRTWLIRCVPAPGYFKTNNFPWQCPRFGPQQRHPWAALAGGLALTGLLASFLVSLFRRGERIAQLVEERTAGLVRANRELAQEIRTRTEIEERLEASLKEKEILLREVHHRVRNNLQVISSLLQLKTLHVSDPTFLRLVKDMRNRVRSMALVYDKLQRSEDLAQIDLGEYLRSLAADLYRSRRGQQEDISLRFELETIRLNLDTAIPCGLIANELVTNAFRYAFPAPRESAPLPAGNSPAVITVQARTTGDGLIGLTVKDNGAGLPPNVSLDCPGTIGLQIVTMLVEQLNGAISLDRSDGTQFTVTFRELQYQSRS